MPYFTRLERYLDLQYERFKIYILYQWSNLTQSTVIFFIGFFSASGIATLIGQTGDWDVLVSAIIVSFNEMVSKWAYGLGIKQNQSILLFNININISSKSTNFPIKDQINQFKLGLLYGLFIDAFKLGS